jgi:hypothetical protein
MLDRLATAEYGNVPSKAINCWCVGDLFPSFLISSFHEAFWIALKPEYCERAQVVYAFNTTYRQVHRFCLIFTLSFPQPFGWHSHISS